MAGDGRSKSFTLALYANAAGLALIGLGLLTRDGGPSLLPAAMAQQTPQPIAGGAGLYLMPGQLSTGVWGCYVMDVDRQTLMVYQFTPGERKLGLLAARDFSNDRRLRNYNSSGLTPNEVKELVDREAKAQANP